MAELRAALRPTGDDSAVHQDDGSNRDLRFWLPFILDICNDMRTLCSTQSARYYLEADYRKPIERLMRYVWRASDSDRMIMW